MQPIRNISEHPRDIFQYLDACLKKQIPCVLVTVVHVEGSSSRSVGSVMVVSADNRHAGYVSNGCVDSDILKISIVFVNLSAWAVFDKANAKITAISIIGNK